MTGPIRFHPQQGTESARTLPSPIRFLAVLGLVLAGVGVIALLGEGISRVSSKAVEVLIPEGTTFVAELTGTVSTENAEVGDRVSLVTTEPLQGTEEVLLPAGLLVEGEVTHSKDGGRVAGAPELTIRFTALELDGKHFRMRSEPLRMKGKDDLGKSAKQVGGGAVAGAVIGAITGNVGRGLVLGAAVGSGVAIATDGGHIVLPVGQQLQVRLADTLRVKYEPKAGPDSQQ